jgi:cellulose synthase/poly-beta-1,6-N-acetylglucosamine synthase-like glycosyltransferase
MVIKRSILDRFHGSMKTSIEDAELTITLGSENIPIRYLKEAVVFDPKPAEKSAAINQRARWLKGQLQLVRSKPKVILKLISRGLPGWSLLLTVLGKPRSLFLPIKTGLFMGSILLAIATPSISALWIAIAMLLGIDIMLQFIALLFALRFVNDKVCALRAFVFLPYFLFLWVRSVALACSSKDPWLRARPLSLEVIVNKSGRTQAETP